MNAGEPKLRLPHASVAFIGPFQSGSSTLVGHMMYQAGAIDQRTIDKYRAESALIGKASFFYAWWTDTLKREREIGATYHLSTRYMSTQKRRYTLHTTPGSPDHLKMLICGVALADFAVLVVDGSLPEDKLLEKATTADKSPKWRNEPTHWQRNVSQLKEQLLICQGLGIKKLIIAVSQLDKLAQPYSQEHFDAVCNKALIPTLKATGFSVDDVPIVPVSGFMGENLTKPSEHLKWYKGPPLMQIIESLPNPIYSFDLPLRMSVFDVYKIGGIGTVVVGRVESGMLEVGHTVVRLLPIDKQCTQDPITLGSIEAAHENRRLAYTGEYVGLNLK